MFQVDRPRPPADSTFTARSAASSRSTAPTRTPPTGTGPPARCASTSTPKDAEFGDPPGLAFRAPGGVVLLRLPVVRPGPFVPRPQQPGAGFLPGVFGAPLPFVPGDVRGDLRGPFRHRRHHRHELRDLPVRVHGVPVAGQRGPELRVPDDGAVPDAVDRALHPQHLRRVDAPPLPRRRHPGVHLQMQVPVRVTTPGGVVPDRGQLDPLHGHLPLLAAAADPGAHRRGEEPADLRRRPGPAPRPGPAEMSRVQPGGQRPGLRPVHDDLGEPQRVLVVAQRPLVQAGADVDAFDPRFVGVAAQLHPVGHVTRASVDGDHFGDPGALGQVVVIGPVVVGLHVGAGPPAAAPVELHPALHNRSP